MKALSRYSIFPQEELHSAVTKKKPKVPGYKGRYSSMHFPTPFMGNTEPQKNLWAYICLVDTGFDNALWFGAWAKCLNLLFL